MVVVVVVVAIAVVRMVVVRMVVACMAAARMAAARTVLVAGMVVVCAMLEVGANPVQGLDHLFLEPMVVSYSTDCQTGRTSSHLLSVGNLDS